MPANVCNVCQRVAVGAHGLPGKQANPVWVTAGLYVASAKIVKLSTEYAEYVIGRYAILAHTSVKTCFANVTTGFASDTGTNTHIWLGCWLDWLRLQMKNVKRC